MTKRFKKETLSGNGAQIVECQTCNRKISNERYLRCLRCPNFFQCLQCWSIGSENKTHLRGHEMIVIEPYSGPCVTQDWDKEEEVLLLAAIKCLGIGNWNDVSEYVRTKTSLECETHYMKGYIESKTAPFPISDVLPAFELPPPPPYDTKACDSNPSEGHPKNLKLRNKKDKTTPAEYSDFMPHRHEFDTDKDYEAEAETLVAEIEFSQCESEAEFEQKKKQLLRYNSVISERHFRTQTVEDWDIHHREYKTPYTEIDPNILKGYSNEEKALDAKLLPLAPYLGHDKTFKIAQNLHKCLKIDKMILNRQAWQQKGVRTIAEGHLYNSLCEKIKDNKIIPASEVDDWNSLIMKYDVKSAREVNSEVNLLSTAENELCTLEKIHPQVFYCIKDLIIREYTSRKGRLSKSDAQRHSPELKDDIGKVYDFLLKKGLISN